MMKRGCHIPCIHTSLYRVLSTELHHAKCLASVGNARTVCLILEGILVKRVVGTGQDFISMRLL